MLQWHYNKKVHGFAVARTTTNPVARIIPHPPQTTTLNRALHTNIIPHFCLNFKCSVSCLVSEGFFGIFLHPLARTTRMTRRWYVFWFVFAFVLRGLELAASHRVFLLYLGYLFLHPVIPLTSGVRAPGVGRARTLFFALISVTIYTRGLSWSLFSGFGV